MKLGVGHDVRNPGEIIDRVIDAVAWWHDFAVANGIGAAQAAMVEAQHCRSLE